MPDWQEPTAFDSDYLPGGRRRPTPASRHSLSPHLVFGSKVNRYQSLSIRVVRMERGQWRHLRRSPLGSRPRFQPLRPFPLTAFVWNEFGKLSSFSSCGAIMICLRICRRPNGRFFRDHIGGVQTTARRPTLNTVFSGGIGGGFRTTAQSGCLPGRE